eukprot:scaffold139152_cov16-Tisochrysis_lutea.AAC.1
MAARREAKEQERKELGQQEGSTGGKGRGGGRRGGRGGRGRTGGGRGGGQGVGGRRGGRGNGRGGGLYPPKLSCLQRSAAFTLQERQTEKKSGKDYISQNATSIKEMSFRDSQFF